MSKFRAFYVFNSYKKLEIQYENISIYQRQYNIEIESTSPIKLIENHHKS